VNPSAIPPPTPSFEQARRVADVTLFEGYVLYPYRASARKNQLRWQFGVLTPPGWAARSGEPAGNQTECLLEALTDDPALRVQVRFLHARARAVERWDGHGFAPVDRLPVGDRVLVAWDEGEPQQVDVPLSWPEVTAGHEQAFAVAGGEETEDVYDGPRLAGRLVRRWHEVTGMVRVAAVPVPGPYGAVRLRVTIENTTPYEIDQADLSPDGDRDEALRRSLIAAHTLIGVTGGRFLSLLDPPEWASPAAAACANLHTWPALVGSETDRDVVLSSPIILYDYPRLAPESPGQLYDATEIDEILTLRTLALAEDEKREARGTDPRAAGVIDQVDDMPPEVLERLHGAIRAMRPVRPQSDPRGDLDATCGGDLGAPHQDHGQGDSAPWWDPGSDPTVSPETDTLTVAGQRIGRGCRVRLRPGRRRTDAQDIFLAGRTATVEAVLHDVDDESYFAVTVDDDPAADLSRAHGRFLYFRSDEVEPVEVRP
jgi:hypothetical protein